MAKNEIEEQHHQTFEEIKQINEFDQEYWSARKLGKVLEYAEYRNFLPVIEKAKEACRNSGQPVEDHFVEMHEMVSIGSGAERKMESYGLSRYACYLIVQNGDPAKPVIANGQTYFAIQTRRQELADNQAFQRLKEDEKRQFLRNELKEHNKQLVEAAQQAGVETDLDFTVFQNHGYRGLYGGLEAKDIHARKGLKKSQKILDHMGSTDTGGKPLPRHTGRRKTASRQHQRQNQRQPDTLRGRREGTQNHRRTRRHHAGRPANARHQRKETGTRTAEKARGREMKIFNRRLPSAAEPQPNFECRTRNLECRRVWITNCTNLREWKAPLFVRLAQISDQTAQVSVIQFVVK